MHHQVPQNPGAGGDPPPDVLALGIGYRKQYEGTGNPEALELSVLALESLLAEVPPGHDGREGVLAALGLSLRARYELAGAPDDLARALALHEEAARVAPDHPHAAGMLSNLAGTLRMRYEREGRVEDLQRAVTAYRQAVALAPADSPWRPMFLNNLGNGLRTAFERGGDSADIDDSVAAFSEAVATAAEGSVDQVRALGNLAGALGERFVFSGAMRDGEQAVAAAERALGHTAGTAREPDHRTVLSVALARLYTGTGQLELLDRAVAEQDAAVRQSHPRAPETVSRVANLAGILDLRYRVAGSAEDLDLAIRLYELAVSLQSGQAPDAFHRLGSLGSALLQRFELRGERSDLDAAVGALERGVAAAERMGAEAVAELAGVRLANALILRHEMDGRQEDLEQAIGWYRRGMAALPAGSDGELKSRLGLGQALARVAPARRGGTTAAEIHGLFRTACRDAGARQPELVLRGALNWSRWAVHEEAWQEAVEAGRLAQETIRRMFATHALRPHREAWLRQAQGLPAETAYALARTGDVEGAVEVLEQGQALLLSDALERERARLDELERAGRSDLAHRYRAAAARVESQRMTEIEALRGGRVAEVLAPLKDAQAELDAIIDGIRRIPGFSDFLAPAGFEEASEAAARAPLVYIAAASRGGIALVVRRGAATVPVWLDTLTRSAFAERFAAYARAYDSGDLIGAIDELTAWSWRAVMGPLVEALADAPAVRVVPVGALALLPLHAAWTSDGAAPDGRRYVLDATALSVAPNARAFSVADGRLEPGPWQLLAVGDPQPVDAPPLEHAAEEVARVRSWFPEAQTLLGEEATREAVLTALPECGVLHLACHGRARLAAPLESALLLAHDESLTLRELLGRPLKGLRLTVLSACETALPGSALPDEVIGLPAGLLQAGSAGVISSLWRVPDVSTMALISRLFEGWRGAALPPAEALRQAQLWMRTSTNEEKARAFPDVEAFAPPEGGGRRREFWGGARSWAHPYHWAAFIHVGA